MGSVIDDKSKVEINFDPFSDNSSPASLKALAMQLSDSYAEIGKLFNYEQSRGIMDKVRLLNEIMFGCFRLRQIRNLIA